MDIDAMAKIESKATTGECRMRPTSMRGESLLQIGVKSDIDMARCVQMGTNDVEFFVAARTFVPDAIEEIRVLKRALEMMSSSTDAEGIPTTVEHFIEQARAETEGNRC